LRLGVTYRNVHAADEGIEIASIDPVYRIYSRAVQLVTGMTPSR